MPLDPTLQDQIRKLSPGALAIFKRQLASLPEQERQRAFARLADIPELSDIAGPEPRQARIKAPKVAKAVEEAAEVPMWQRALKTFGAPFEFVTQKAIKPTAALATAPFTPTTAETAQLPWWQRQMAEYEQWEAPSLKLGFKYPGFLGGGEASIGVKGALEEAPWFAIPGFGQIGGKIGGLASKAGRFAPLVKGVGKAIEYSPYGLVEKGMALPLKGVEKGIKAGVKAARKGQKVKEEPKFPEKFTKDIWGISSVGAKTEILKHQGLPETWATKTYKEYDELFEDVLAAKVKALPIEAVPPAAAKGKPTVEVAEGEVGEAGPKIAKELGVKYDGVQPEIGMQFTDPITGSTTYGNTVDEVAQNVRRLRKGFAEAEQAKIDAKLEAKPPMMLPPGKKPPAPPMLPPGKEPDFGDMDDLIKRFNTAALSDKAKALEDVKVGILKAGRGRRFRRAEDRIAKLAPEERTTSQMRQIFREELRGRYTELTPLGFTQEEKEILGAYVARKLNPNDLPGKGGIILSTIQAMEKALDGDKVNRIVTAEGEISAYQKLVNVFGEPFADVLATPKKAQQLAKKLRGKGEEGAATEYPPMGPMQQFPEEAALYPFGTTPSSRRTEGLRPAPLGFEPETKPFGPTRGPAGFKAGEAEVVATEAERQNWFKQGDDRVAEYLTKKPPKEAAEQLALLPDVKRNGVIVALKKRARNSPDAINVLRSTLASGDFSGMLLQGAIFFARHPLAAWQATAPMVRAALSREYADTIDKLILGDPRIQRFFAPDVKEVPFIAELPEKLTAQTLAKGEEAFMSNLVTRIPVLGHLVKGSSRSYVTFLNLARYHMMLDAEKGVFNQMRKAGIPVTSLEYTEMSKLINRATGRGSLLGLNKYGWLVSTALFSPRLLMSRFQWPMMVASPSKAVRVEAWKQIASFAGVFGGIMAAIELTGQGKGEYDPRSSSFGKLKVAEFTYLDFWGGYSQHLRFIAALATAQHKTSGGYVIPMNREETVWRYLQTKASPAAGLFKDILAGQTFTGEAFPPTKPGNIAEQLYERSFPLALQDMIDGYRQSGTAGVVSAFPSTLGIGVTTYMDATRKEQERVAQENYGMTWEQLGRTEKGRIVQATLMQTDPAIQKAVLDRDAKFSNQKHSILNSFRSQGDAIEATYRKAVGQAAAEFRQTGDGSLFREKANELASFRRRAYGSRATEKQYQPLIAYYNRPLTDSDKATMNPWDVMRNEYYSMMFNPDMYDQETGNYNYEEAELREEELRNKYGEEMLNSLDEYREARWLEEPQEMKALRAAKKILKPYWALETVVWSQFPKELQEKAEEVAVLNRTDPRAAKRLLRQHPQIVRAEALILRAKQRWARQNPEANQIRKMFYGR